MKYIFTNFLIAIMILSTVSGAFPVLVKAQTEVLTNEQVLHDEGVENSENEVVILKEENEESPKEIVSDEVVNEETLNTDEGVKNEEISESEKDEGEYDYNKDDESKEDNGEQGGDEENNEDEVHSTYCLEGGDMSVEEVARAYSDGLLSFDLATSTGTRFAIFSVTNNTNCTLPISLSSYKMFDNVLSHQEFYAGTGLVHATSSTSIRVELPLCTAQVDAWYGLHPKYLLDSNPYGYPNVPMVIKYGYVNVSNLCKHEVENTPPVITLVGANPINVNVGDDFTDPGATALDLEDGDITSNIVAQNNVDTNITGTYTITYNVVDSGGLHAQEVLRTVNVLNVEHGSNGTITFCLAIADSQNVLATSSTNLPSGLFTINLATSTNFASSTVNSKTWSTSTFSPNNKVILSENDVDCVSFTDLELGTYNYSQLSVSGSLWKEPKYNDQDLQPVNNVFDFFLFDDNNSSSDGKIVIDESRRERTIYLLDSYKPAPQCDLPVITSPLTASGVVGTQFTYNLTASSTTDILSVSTSTLPAWLSFATSTNILSGVPTDAGTFNIGMSASNDCGLDSQILVLTITSGGGGGGGPTADLDILKSSDKTVVDVGDTVTYTITATNHGPNDATNVSLTDLLPSTLTFVSSTSTVGSYATSTGIWTIGDLANNATSSLTIVATINSDTYGQTITNTATASSTVSDPDSGNNTSFVDVKVNPAPVTGCTTNCGGGGGGGGGGNGPIVGSLTSTGGSIVVPPTPNSCYYLFDYLRKDFNNNPIEVKKLQVFLRDLEGFSTVEITGVYDDQTIVALNAFQDRYKDDILTPWGHTAPTSYTYILTKKKVNEIYCKTAFPVTVQQQEEIDAYRNFLQGLRDSGIDLSGTGTLPVDNSNNTVTPEFIDKVVNGEVGVNDTDNDNAGNQATLAGYSSSTRNIVSNLTANVISSGKRLVNFLLGLFAWPFGKTNSDDAVQCVDDSYLGIGWLNVILILIIIVISYLWYREYRNNKRIEELNKVIDLE